MLETDVDNNARAKGAKFNSCLPDLNKVKYDAPLPVLLSCRVRLSEIQRDTLKQAWRKYQSAQLNNIPVASTTPGSTVRVETFYETPAPMPGLSSLVISDLITSRDTIPLTTLLNLSASLGVEVITKADLQKAFDGYWEFVSSEANKLYGN